MVYTMRTDEELKQIAKDCVDGKIFTSSMVKDNDSLSMVFMPLIFMNEEQSKEFEKAIPYMLFEYYDKAGPRSINGMPIFYSFQQLSKQECEKLQDYVNKIREGISKVMDNIR